MIIHSNLCMMKKKFSQIVYKKTIDSNRSYGVFGAEGDYQLYEITANNQQ